MKPKFYRKVLKNGMTVILEKRDIPVVSVAFAVRGGGINESEREKGISHFIEHMIYKGTPLRNAKQIAEEIEKKGGDLNGFTAEEITAFHCKIPSKHLNIALDVLSDIIKNPLFDSKEIEKERHVIREEIKLIRDNPLRYVFHRIDSLLYDKPFGMDIVGNKNTIKSFSREDLVKRFKAVYQPNNMILAIVGDADFKEVIKFVEKKFGNKKGGVPYFKVKKKNGTKLEIRKGIDQANLVFAFHSPVAKDRKKYAAQVLITLMAGGMSSRLWSEIREKRNLAYVVKGNVDVGKDYSFSVVYVGTTKENVDEVRKIILGEFKKVSKNLSEKNLQQIKEQLIGNYQIAMEDSQAQMINLLECEINGNAKEFYDFEKNIQSVRLKDVKELAKKAVDKYSFFALLPE